MLGGQIQAWLGSHFGLGDALLAFFIMVLMMWLYIAGLAILFGSEINALVKRYDDAGKQNVGNTIDQRKRNPDTR